MKTIKDKMREMDKRIESLETAVQFLQEENRKLRTYIKSDISGEPARNLNPQSVSQLFEEIPPVIRKTEDLFAQEQREELRTLPPFASVNEGVSREEAANLAFEEVSQGAETADFAPEEVFEQEELSVREPLQPEFSQEKGTKDRESLVGKYLIGALASLLIFIGAASFVAIIWNKISDETKLLIIHSAGLLLAAAGLRFSLKKPGPIPSLLFGTGAGLVYIGIVSSSLAFHLISDRMSILLCALWTLLLIFSYRYTRLFFTILIAYIGSYINLLLALPGARDSAGFVLLFCFVTAVSTMMLFTLRKGEIFPFRLSLFLSAAAYITLLQYIYRFADRREAALAEIGSVLGLLVLKNLFYLDSNRAATARLHFILTAVSSAFLFCAVLPFNQGIESLVGELTNLQAILIFFVIHGIQFLANNRLCPEIEEELSFYYGAVLYLSGVALVGDLLEVPSAALILIALFALRRKLSGHLLPLHFLLGMLTVDTLLIFFPESSEFFRPDERAGLIFTAANTFLTFALPRICGQKSRFEVIVKNLSLLILLINGYLLTTFGAELIGPVENRRDLEVTVRHLLWVFSLLFVHRTGYLVREEDPEESEEPPQREQLSRYFGFLFALVFVFVKGAGYLDYIFSDLLEVLLILSVSGVSLLQTFVSLSLGHRWISKAEGLWMLIKFTGFVIVCDNGFWVFLFALAHFTLVLRIFSEDKDLPYPIVAKNTALLALIVSCLPFCVELASVTGLEGRIAEIGGGLGVVMGTAVLLLVARMNLIGREDPEREREGSLFARLPWYSGLYLAALLLYLTALYGMNETKEVVVKILFTLSALVSGFFQSYLSLSGRKEVSRGIGIWLVIKYLAMLWSTIHAFLDLPADSVVYSVSGLILAVAAIYFGFRKNIRVTRHFGLVLTLTMVAKFILVDLRGENSLTRVIAFVAGGVLCFLISLIYNRLSKN